MMLLYLGLGGGIGAVARFGVGSLITVGAGGGFPWATFAVNVIGSALLGFLNRSLPAFTISAEARAFSTVGLCGGFTTFSTFDYETFLLLQQGRYLLAATYSLASVGACIAGVLIGLRMAERVSLLGGRDQPPSVGGRV